MSTVSNKTHNLSDAENELLSEGFNQDVNNDFNDEHTDFHEEEAAPITLMLAKAVRHHRYGELSKAEVIYQAILQREPNHANAMKKYGVLLFQFGDYSAAEQMFEQAYSIVVFDEQLSINLIMCKQKLKKTVDIIPVIQVILKHNPTSLAGKELFKQFNLSSEKVEEIPDSVT